MNTRSRAALAICDQITLLQDLHKEFSDVPEMRTYIYEKINEFVAMLEKASLGCDCTPEMLMADADSDARKCGQCVEAL